MRIEGAHELQAALLSLPDKVSKKIMGKALRAGAEVVLGEARYLAPVKTGALAGGMQITMSNKGGEASAIVSAASQQYYGNMQEFGTKRKSAADKATGKRRIRGGNNGSWHVKPNPFMHKAIEATVSDATDAIAESLADGIETAFGESVRTN